MALSQEMLLHNLTVLKVLFCAVRSMPFLVVKSTVILDHISKRVSHFYHSSDISGALRTPVTDITNVILFVVSTEIVSVSLWFFFFSVLCTPCHHCTCS